MFFHGYCLKKLTVPLAKTAVIGGRSGIPHEIIRSVNIVGYGIKTSVTEVIPAAEFVQRGFVVAAVVKRYFLWCFCNRKHIRAQPGNEVSAAFAVAP